MKTTNLILLATVMLASIASNAQEVAMPTPTAVSLGDNVSMKIGGFLKSDAIYDSRRNEEAVDGLMLFYPKNIDDAHGSDLNQMDQYRIRAISSRLLTKFSGPDMLGAKSSAMIEFDFTGVSSIGLRLRHAYLKLNWTNSEALFGRYWHPIVPIEDGKPMVAALALNTGAPFVAFVRYEQFRYTYTLGQLSAFAAISNSFDYSYPLAADQKTYLYNPVMPDLSANVQYKSDILLLGVTCNYKVNRPKLSVTGTEGVFKAKSEVASSAIMSYARVKVNKLIVKGGVTYGENLREFNMMGGFFIKERNTQTGRENYATLNNISYWGNILYGGALQGGIFGGYEKNLGSNPLRLLAVTKDFSRGQDIDHLIRIAPQISYKTGRMQFIAEFENTLAAYGTANINDHAKVTVVNKLSNQRVQFTGLFFF